MVESLRMHMRAGQAVQRMGGLASSSVNFHTRTPWHVTALPPPAQRFPYHSLQATLLDR